MCRSRSCSRLHGLLRSYPGRSKLQSRMGTDGEANSLFYCPSSVTWAAGPRREYNNLTVHFFAGADAGQSVAWLLHRLRGHEPFEKKAVPVN